MQTDRYTNKQTENQTVTEIYYKYVSLSISYLKCRKNSCLIIKEQKCSLLTYISILLITELCKQRFTKKHAYNHLKVHKEQSVLHCHVQHERITQFLETESMIDIPKKIKDLKIKLHMSDLPRHNTHTIICPFPLTQQPRPNCSGQLHCW